jgi:hypothetical protein
MKLARDLKAPRRDSKKKAVKAYIADIFDEIQQCRV